MRCTKSASNSVSSVCGNLVSAHRALYEDLSRLHRYTKNKETDLDEDVARVMLEKVEMFMERFASLTAQFHLAPHDLRNIFDKAIV